MGVTAGGVTPGGTRLLLDTHALVWWWTDDRRLPAAARAAIAAPDNVVLVSAASAWELATKHRQGKWIEVAPLVEEFDDLLRRSRFAPLPITPTQARLAGSLDWSHRDPFDRMLLAQARDQAIPLVTGDAVFHGCEHPVIW
jgi:PIN domain nuclease of toxin-antitoxin system